MPKKAILIAVLMLSSLFTFSCSEKYYDSHGLFAIATGTYGLKFNVDFDSQGGSAVAGQVVAYRGLVIMPATPVKDGYVFNGWYGDSSFAALWDFNNDSVTAPITLYARWTVNTCTVSFDPNGGGGTMQPQTIACNATAALRPNTFTLSGYYFAGWATTPSGTVSYSDGDDYAMGAASVTLYAIWEAFEESNRPNLAKYTDAVNNDYYFCTPWNYGKDYNANRKYPLLIYLHGTSQADYLRNLYYMGYDNSDLYGYDVAGNFKKTYPCFIYVPRETGSSWDTAKLINQINALRSAYRIDDNRLYLHGFSMGGSATFLLANNYYAQEGGIFAGIIRLTGWNTTPLNENVAYKAGVWLMIGLNDTVTPTVVADMRNRYDELEALTGNAAAVETEQLDYYVDTHLANTWTLSLAGQEIVKRTEYPNDDHFIAEFPFKDSSVMAWLFSRSLKNR